MKFILRGILALSLLCFLAAPAGAQAVPPAPGLGMASGILVDSSGRVLWSRDPLAPRPPASLTKIMTALVVLERADLNAKVMITPEARAAPGGRLYVETGWRLSVRDLLWGLLLNSGNDAAIALAQKVSPDGTAAGFVKLMNERAAEIGARRTTFKNPHGYDEADHLTNASDLALITLTAMRHPLFSEIVRTRTHAISWPGGKKRTLVNHNKLLETYPGAAGVKTGFTNGAGHSLVSAVRRDGVELVAVVLGAPPNAHYAESAALHDWAFANLPALMSGEAGNVLSPADPILRTKAPGESSPQAPLSLEGGLRVVQIGPEAAAAARSPAPPTPVQALVLGVAVAAVIGTLTVRRRRQRRLKVFSMLEFREAMHALGGSSSGPSGPIGLGQTRAPTSSSDWT